MNPEVMSIITNKALIALNQDSAGYQVQCVMNCQMQNSVEVFKVQAVDQGGYTAVLAINWDTQNEATINLDLVLMGVTTYRNQACNVTNMWIIGSLPEVANNSYYTVTKIAPNGNAALKITCAKSIGLEEELEEEKSFLY